MCHIRLRHGTQSVPDVLLKTELYSYQRVDFIRFHIFTDIVYTYIDLPTVVTWVEIKVKISRVDE